MCGPLGSLALELMECCLDVPEHKFGHFGKRAIALSGALIDMYHHATSTFVQERHFVDFSLPLGQYLLQP